MIKTVRTVYRILPLFADVGLVENDCDRDQHGHGACEVEPAWVPLRDLVCAALVASMPLAIGPPLVLEI